MSMRNRLMEHAEAARAESEARERFLRIKAMAGPNGSGAVSMAADTLRAAKACTAVAYRRYTDPLDRNRSQE